MNPDRLAELEDERDHLLRSLADLEHERVAGDLDGDDYTTLRDAYTARAAEVIRSIEVGLAERPARPARNWRRTVATAVAVVAVAAAIGVLVARSSGQRLPGQELTGGLPGDVSATLVEARGLLGTDPARAQALYAEVLAERPTHPEALTYTGWLLAINSAGASPDVRELALDTARRVLDDAIAADPAYADPHCFRAVIAANLVPDPDPDEVATWVEACLDRSPPAAMRGLITELVADPAVED